MSKITVLRARFGARVEVLLVRSGLTSDDLAQASKLPHGRIKRILAGKHNRLTIAEMEIIANNLGTSLHSLLAPAELIAADDGAADRLDDSIADSGRSRTQLN